MNDSAKQNEGIPALGVAAGSELMRTIPAERYEELLAIETGASRLVKAVTKRMASENPDGSLVWEMFQAHGDLQKLLPSPNP